MHKNKVESALVNENNDEKKKGEKMKHNKKV